MSVPDRSSSPPQHTAAHERSSTGGPPEDRVHTLEREREELVRERDAARDAQARSEAALRAREELLAVIVHDLRNPLGTIVMGATALMQGDPSPDPKAQRIRTIAERIHRQAERMTRQLSNLSDFTEIDAGRLAIARAPNAPSVLLASANDVIAPIARERGVTFESRPAPELPLIDCDGERVVQTLTNLAVTAIKSTTRGGVVEIGVQSAPCVFYVRDQITNEPPAVKSAALSMTIARGIVEAHGGRLWSERDATGATTVWFSLAPNEN